MIETTKLIGLLVVSIPLISALTYATYYNYTINRFYKLMNHVFYRQHTTMRFTIPSALTDNDNPFEAVYKTYLIILDIRKNHKGVLWVKYRIENVNETSNVVYSTAEQSEPMFKCFEYFNKHILQQLKDKV